MIYFDSLDSCWQIYYVCILRMHNRKRDNKTYKNILDVRNVAQERRWRLKCIKQHFSSQKQNLLLVTGRHVLLHAIASTEAQRVYGH